MIEVLILSVAAGFGGIVLPAFFIWTIIKKDLASLRADWDSMSREEQMKVKYTERRWNCQIPTSWQIKE